MLEIEIELEICRVGEKREGSYIWLQLAAAEKKSVRGVESAVAGKGRR